MQADGTRSEQTSGHVIELWQTEWCPASHRVRQRLTELGLDCLIHQVPVQADERDALEAIAGCRTIPVLRLADGATIAGEESIIGWLDATWPEPPAAVEHREKAGRALQRLLAEHREQERV